MKKTLAMLLALALALSLAMPALAAVNPPDRDVRIVPEGETIKLTVFQPLTAIVTELNADKNKATATIERDTGLTLEYITAPGADAKTKLNLLLSAGDYPDVISYRGGLDRAAMDQYGKLGIFIPLDEYITPEIAPNTYKLFQENEPAKFVTTGGDGKQYSLPDINECYHCLYGDGRAWYYMPWMQSINEGVMPATTGELTTYLQYIKDNDVNGNGDASDEVPLVFCGDNAGINRFITWVSNFFMVYTSRHYGVNDDGQIISQFIQPEYKQALEYASELYSKGLILPDAFAIKTLDDLRSIGEDPKGARFGLIIGWGPEDGVAKAGTTLRWYEYFPLSPVEGPTSQRNHVYTGQWYGVGNGYFVTDRCANPVEAVKLGDLLLDPYYTYTVYQGEKGKSWDDPTEGALGFNGEPAQFRELVAYGTQEQNSSWDQQSISNRPVSFRMSQEAEGAETIYEYLNGNYDLLPEVSKLGSYNEIMKYYGAQKNLDPYKFDDKYIVPPLIYSDEVADIVADANAAVDAYRLESIAAFVTGTRSLADFDKYVEELRAMGLNDILAAMNDSYSALK